MPLILGYNQWSWSYQDNALVKQWDYVCQGNTKEQILTTFDLVFHLGEAPCDLLHPCWTNDKKKMSYLQTKQWLK